VARRIAEVICEAQQRPPLSAAELVVPVPLHASRERERGFNQALVLAQALVGLNDLTLDEYCLVRQSQTKMHRAGMDAKSRRQSLADAFAVRHSRAITGKRVLLIDDVFTTGATASMCAAALKAAGADKVFVLTLARASLI
jgi:ComF family protein